MKLIKHLTIVILLALLIIGLASYLFNWGTNYTVNMLVKGMIFVIILELYRSFKNRKKNDAIRKQASDISTDNQATPINKKSFFNKKTIIVGVLVASSIIIYMAYSISKSTPVQINSQSTDWSKASKAVVKKEIDKLCEKDDITSQECNCIFNSLVNKYTLDELNKIGDEFEKTGIEPPGLKEAISTCISD